MALGAVVAASFALAVFIGYGKRAHTSESTSMCLDNSDSAFVASVKNQSFEDAFVTAHGSGVRLLSHRLCAASLQSGLVFVAVCGNLLSPHI